jgi:medium-chain acyl-[acyl-carrier-protein] hydrolase
VTANRPAPSGSGDDAVPLTLYCLPHAGGSAAPYQRWRSLVPPGVTVHPLELPGHGGRLREPPVQRMDLLVAELVRVIDARPGQRFALFGHSFGALLSYELTRRLHQRGTPPALLLVAGRNGPSEPLSHRPIHHLPHDEFLTALRRFGGMPEVLLQQPALLKVYVPALRADLRITETYVRAPGPALDIPVCAFAGRRDVLTDPAGMLAWQRETTRAFDLALVPGQHFFLEEPEFHSALAHRLARAVRPTGVSASPAASGTPVPPAASVAPATASPAELSRR